MNIDALFMNIDVLELPECFDWKRSHFRIFLYSSAWRPTTPLPVKLSVSI